MRLTVVGCSGSGPGPASPASAYLVQAAYEGRTFSLLLDCGPGAFGALYRYLDPRRVDAVALSHLHPDHCLDLCAFYVAARYSGPDPWPSIPVYGPTGTAERLNRAYEVPDRSGHVADADGIATHFDYRDWGREQAVGPFTLTTAPVDHPVEAYALRVTERATGAVLTYSGDTAACPALVALARGADLLLAEASFLDRPGNPEHLHMTGPEAARVAAEAGVRRLVLTHIPAWHDPEQVLLEAHPYATVPVELARGGAVYTVETTR